MSASTYRGGQRPRTRPVQHNGAGGRLDIIQKLTFDILERLEERSRHASEEIARAFKRGRRLHSDEAAAISERVYGILRTERFLDYLIDESGPVAESGAARRRARWFAREILERRLRPADAAKEMPKVDWVRVLEMPARVARIPDPVRRLAITASLPDWLAARLVDEFGEAEAFALARAWNEPAPQTLRANPLRIDRDALLARFRDYGLEPRPTEHAADGIILGAKRNVFRSSEFQEGLFEVQDEGSQLISELVAPPPGGIVLDACAGSGGKTLHLGTLLAGKGRVVAVGYSPAGVRKLEELERRVKRAGLRNVQSVRIGDGTTPDAAQTASRPGPARPAGRGSSFAGLGLGDLDLEQAELDAAEFGELGDVGDGGEQLGEPGGPSTPGRFGDADPPADLDVETASAAVGAAAAGSEPSVDAPWPAPLAKLLGRVDRVLVDAPCSGLGVLRRNPEARRRVDPATVTRLAALQRSILERFAPFVRPGGRLVYATCSVLREENDDVIADFLADHPEFQVMPAKEILGKARALAIGDGECLRLSPHRQGTDGFFAVVLRRTG